jgi:hypothetical protein
MPRVSATIRYRLSERLHRWAARSSWGHGRSTYRYLSGLVVGVLGGYLQAWGFVVWMGLVPLGMYLLVVALRGGDRRRPPATCSPACLEGHTYAWPCAQTQKARRP